MINTLIDSLPKTQSITSFDMLVLSYWIVRSRRVLLFFNSIGTILTILKTVVIIPL